jgi:hypothetical protein
MDFDNFDAFKLLTSCVCPLCSTCNQINLLLFKCCNLYVAGEKRTGELVNYTKNITDTQYQDFRSGGTCG